jgi:hypothetical protein
MKPLKASKDFFPMGEMRLRRALLQKWFSVVRQSGLNDNSPAL